MRPLVNGFKPQFKDSTGGSVVPGTLNSAKQLQLNGKHVIDAIYRCLNDASLPHYWTVENYDPNNEWIIIRNDFDVVSKQLYERQRIRFWSVSYEVNGYTKKNVALEYHKQLPNSSVTLDGSSGLLSDGSVNSFKSPTIRMAGHGRGTALNCVNDGNYDEGRAGYYFSRYFNSNVIGMNVERHSFIIELEDAIIILISRSGHNTPIPSHWTLPHHNGYNTVTMIGKIHAPMDDDGQSTGHGVHSGVVNVDRSTNWAFAFCTELIPPITTLTDYTLYDFDQDQHQALLEIENYGWSCELIRNWTSFRPDGTIFSDQENLTITNNFLKSEKFSPIFSISLENQRNITFDIKKPIISYHKYARLSPFHPRTFDDPGTTSFPIPRIPGSIVGSANNRWIMAAAICRGALSDSGAADGFEWGTNLVFPWANNDTDVFYAD